jgi:hypothetical protein
MSPALELKGAAAFNYTAAGITKGVLNTLQTDAKTTGNR